MAIDWSLLGPPVDMFSAVNRGFEHGREIRRRGTMERAFSDLAQNPEDTQAQASAFSVDPVAASQAMGAFRHNREAQQAERQRAALAGAIDPTGHIDTGKVRQVLAASGDINQLMNFDAAQAKNQGEISEQHLEQIKVGAKLLSGVRDEASYQRALAMFKQLGYPLDDIPPNFDPSYVQQVVEAGAHLEAKSGTPPNIEREVDYYRSIGRPELAEQLLARHAEGPPAVSRNEDGTFTVVPRAAIQGAGSAPDRPTSRHEYEALPPGSPYIAPDGSHRVKGGASPSNGSTTFP